MDKRIHCALLVLTLSSIAFTQELQPETTCPAYVPEHGNVNCTCKAPVGVHSPMGAVFSWPTHSHTDRLTLNKVSRQLSGKKYRCQMKAGNVTTFVDYTLQVAYGPFENSTHVTGPDLFITDGSKAMTLTCLASDVHPEAVYTWPSLACDNTTSNTCTFTPRVPTERENAAVRYFCTATNTKNLNERGLAIQSQAAFVTHLSYPPQTKPRIYTTAKQPLKSGDVVSCTVHGGNPAVSDVILRCANPRVEDEQDETNTPLLPRSSFVVETSQATERNMTCVCSAVWEPAKELYRVETREEFMLEYKAQVTNVTFNHSRQLTVTENDKVTVTLICQGSGRPDPDLTLYKEDKALWRRSASEKRKKRDEEDREFVIRSVTCEHMGEYRCEANNGFPDPDTKSATLLVNCAPRPYNHTANISSVSLAPVELSPSGLSFLLLAYPTPRHFRFRFLGNGSASEGRDVSGSAMFLVECGREKRSEPRVRCTLTATSVTEEQLGVYSLVVSNDFGQFSFAFVVAEPVTEEETKTATVIGLAIASAVVLCLLLVLVGAVKLYKRNNSTASFKPISAFESEMGSGHSTHIEAEVPSPEMTTSITSRDDHVTLPPTNQTADNPKPVPLPDLVGHYELLQEEPKNALTVVTSENDNLTGNYFTLESQTDSQLPAPCSAAQEDHNYETLEEVVRIHPHSNNKGDAERQNMAPKHGEKMSILAAKVAEGRGNVQNTGQVSSFDYKKPSPAPLYAVVDLKKKKNVQGEKEHSSTANFQTGDYSTDHNDTYSSLNREGKQPQPPDPTYSHIGDM